MWRQLTSAWRVLGARVGAETGQTLVEYALILTLVVLAVVGGLLALTGTLTGFLDTVDGALGAA